DAQKGGPALLDWKWHPTGETTVSFNPDGTRIVTGRDDGTAAVIHARTGAVLLELKGRGRPAQYAFNFMGGVLSVSFSPDGARIVTACGEVRRPGTATVWDARTGAALLERKGFKGAVKCVSFSPDGTRIVTGGGEFEKPGEARVWDARTGTALVELK